MGKTKFERRSFRSYQKIADHYDDSPEGRYTLAFKELLLEMIQIPDGSKVLDVACGNGRLLEMMSRRQPLSGFGVDISDKMVENARRLNPSMVFRQACCDALPFEDASMDVVTVCAAYHHFPDVDAFAREAWRTLKPDGKLYIAEVYYPRWLRALCNPLIRFSRAGDVRLYSPEEILRVMEKVGFQRDTQRIQGYIQILSVQKSPGKNPT